MAVCRYCACVSVRGFFVWMHKNTQPRRKYCQLIRKRPSALFYSFKKVYEGSRIVKFRAAFHAFGSWGTSEHDKIKNVPRTLYLQIPLTPKLIQQVWFFFSLLLHLPFCNSNYYYLVFSFFFFFFSSLPTPNKQANKKEGSSVLVDVR